MAIRGKFITLEGIEGCGKSTQAEKLAGRLSVARRKVHLTREPGGTEIGTAIRAILGDRRSGNDMCPETELLLFAASRAQLIRRLVIPLLNDGVIVVSDRFMDSTTAYQAHARGIPIEKVLEINRFATAGTVPDLTILLDIDVTDGLSRVRRRNKVNGTVSDRIEAEGPAFHERVRAGFLDIASRDPDRVRVVDASADTETVSEHVWRLVSDVIG